MKILTGSQIREADKYTIEHEPVKSINLMERAAEMIAQWICNNIPMESLLLFFIGKGNNGGDGLAVARMLYNAGYDCTIYLAADKTSLSEDCRYNLERLPRGLKATPLTALTSLSSSSSSFTSSLTPPSPLATPVPPSPLATSSLSPTTPAIPLPENAVIIDALLGSGARGEVEEPFKSVIEMINATVNAANARVISIDMPSGMPTEMPAEDAGSLQTVVKASTTLTIQFPKLSMLLPESGEAAGEIVVLDIGLAPEFLASAQTPYHYIDKEVAISILKPRSKFAHKGSYGHALLICGSKGMAGAAVLATGAALRSGCGLVTIHLPETERGSMHATNPSAIVSCDAGTTFSELPADIDKYSSTGVGCGLGKAPQTVKTFEALLKIGKPLVIDADALNIISENPALTQLIPAGSVLTPHIGELKRLTGEWGSDRERNEMSAKFAADTSSVIVVKGAHTMICMPDGRMFFNSTGNAGMAQGGSGDVLTGYITGLMARGYNAEEAAILGVYVHGAAGDKAAEYFGMEGMNSGDIIDFLGEAINELS